MEVDVMERSEAGGSKLADLYVRHAQQAVGFAYLVSGDRHLAEDLAQEAFVRLAGRFQHLRNADAFDAYLKRTIVNLHTSWLRRRRLERRYLRREEGRASHPVTGVDEGPGGDVWEAMKRLPPRQRAAVVLRHVEDLSERQAAAVLGCSAAATRSLVARGMESLRREMRGRG